MKRVLFCASALVAIAACAGTSLPVSGTPVAMIQSRAVDSGQTIGGSTTLIRTFAADAAGDVVEVSGVTCRLRSDQFTAQVITPQFVTYPNFLQASRFANRGRPDPLVVTCRNGDKAGTQVVTAVTQGGPGSRTTNSTSTSGTTTVSTAFVPLTGNIASSYPWTFPAEVRVTVE
ncbi:hypothetical protein [Roseobacter sp. CCS2]|uniref:hypothetical protein n=1 Tax=Roseobacter sp. CCS2 TaxID=391593 RepID=UPI0000F40381|nr:hypothetical protein [Roseobacter sp. CCS2]EBA13763.1 hypothetical protein RCCS2_07739 [Roseobacter sp. CCS2]